ncbi:hypothetical protein [Jannaschia rubra]|uniref:Uncharacterized protein n=1 Tax=Jannaschia rubra TaxID=282197 RepID=A0A0M6XN06_9RHOB|nr:hypothetical protein [Jannaschia rubra]CTQ31563.1 hypothetical protein JAN5088_00321 [Jannaschia rubra]SFF77190.1 hypothetical protein SAMN04488517_10197 [Jannaschia rubra]
MATPDFPADPFPLPEDVREGLQKARDRDRRKTGGRLRVQVGDAWYPISAYDEHGFEVALSVAPKLRGLVEIHDGARLLRSVLIVAGEPLGEVMRYDIKRGTDARTDAPVDYEQPEGRPSAILPPG